MTTSKSGMSDDIAKAVTQAQILEKTLKSATTDKGISFLKLNQELQKAGTSAEQMVATLASAGPAFSGTLNTFLTSFSNADRSLVSLNSHLKEMQRVMTQSVKFTMAQEIQRFVITQIQDAIKWTRELNEELNTIAIVSGKSAKDMEAVYDVIINKSKELRVAADEYAYASQIFYQQGLSDEEVIRRSDITIKAAKAAGQSTQEMSQQLTAVWNTYNMSGEELERAASVGARMGAETAVEFKDIATAMQISASAASQMGVEYDMLASIIATVGDTTQQSASVIGNAYKTIFSRFDQLVSSGTDGEVTLGRVSQQLSDLGVNILDANGDLIPLGNTIMDLGNRWDEYSQKQQIALAEAIGGTRQFGQVLALFNNWDKFMSNYQSAQSEVGSETLEAQYQKSLESIDSAMTNSAEAWARAFSEIFESDAQIEFYHALEAIGETFGDIVETAGGLKGLLLLIASIAMRQLIPAFEKAKLTFTTMMANRTLEGQQAQTAKEFETMRATTAAANNINYTGNNNFEATSTTTESQMLSNQYAQEKLRISQQVAQQMNIINALEKSSSAEVRNKAAGEKQVLEILQQEALASVDLLQQNTNITKELERQQAAAQKRVDRMMNNAKDGDSKKQAQQAQKQLEYQQKSANLLKEVSKIDSQKNMKDMSKDIMGISQMFGTTTEDAKEFRAELMSISNAMKNGPTEEYGVQLQRLSDAFTRMAQSDDLPRGMRDFVTQMATGFGQAAQAQDQLTASNGRLQASQERLNALYGSAKTQMAGFGQAMLNTLSSAATLSMGLSSLFSMIESGDITLGGIITTLAMVIPSLVSFGGSLKALTSSFSAAIGAGATWAANLKIQTAAQGAQTTVTLGQTLAMKLFTLAEKLGIVVKVEDTAATGALTVANYALNASFGVILLIVLAITAAIAALVAIVIAVVAAFKAWQASTPEGKLKAAEEAAYELNSQLEETKNRAEEVQAAFDDYNSIVDNLNNCTKGTEEWKQALSDVNNQVIALMQDFPELATMVKDGEKAITRNNDGQLEIADWAQEEILNKQEDAVIAAQGAANIGQQNVRQAKINVQRNDLKNSLYGTNYAYDDYGNDMSYTAANLVAKNAESLAGLKPDELKTQLEAIFNDNGITTSVDGWVDTIISMGTDFTDLTAAIQANTEAMNIENQNMADQIMADSGYANSEAGSMALEAGGEIYGQLQQEAYEKYMDTDMANFWGVGTKEGKDMWARYAEELGISDKNGYKVTNYRKDGGVDYEYIDENGQKQEGHATAEMIAATLAAADAANQLEGSLSDLRNTIAELNASEVESDRAMAEFLSKGNFEGATKGEFDDIREAAGYNENATFETNKANAEAYIDKMFDGDLTDEKAKEMGYESADAFITAFTEGLDVDFEVPEGLSDNIADKLSLGAAKAIDQTYDKMGKEGEAGQEAYMNMLDTFEQGLSGLDIEDQEAAWEELANIDWSQMDAAEKAAKVVRKYGGQIDMTTESWKENVKIIQDAMNAAYDVEAEMEKIAAAKKIGEEIEQNAIISKEDYETLVAYNSELQKYFTILADGSAMMTGDILDFQQAMKETEQKKLKDMIKNTEELRDELLSQQQAGIDAVGGDRENVNQYRDTENYVGTDGKNYYKDANVDTQLNFLESQGYDQEKIDAWKLDLEDGETTTKVLQDIASAVDETATSFEAGAQEVINYEAQLQSLQNSYAMTAENSEERQRMLENNEINQTAYDAAANAAINQESWEDLDVEAVQAYADHLMSLQDTSKMTEDELDQMEESMEEVARSVTKMNKGIDSLAEGWEEWGDILKTGNKQGHEASKMSQEYAEAMNETKKALSDVLDVSEEFIDSDFISKPENLELIGKIAEGDADAIDQLAAALAQDIAFDALDELDPSTMINIDGVQYNIDQIKNKFSTLISDIQAQINSGEIRVGDNVKVSEGMFAELQKVVTASEMTAEQANAFYRSMGFVPTYKPVEVTQAQSVPVTTTYHWREYSGEYDEHGNPISWTDHEWSNTEQVDGGTLQSAAPSLSFNTLDGQTATVPSTEIESLTYTGSGSLNNYSSTNSGGPPAGGSKGSGGGGSKAEYKPQNAKREDPIIERYQDITESINEIERKMEDISDASDDAFGATRVKHLQKINKLYQDQAKNLQQLQKEAEKYLEEQDKPGIGVALADVPRGYGLSRVATPEVQYNDDGYVTNAEDVLAPIEAKRKALEDAYISLAEKYDNAGVPNEALEEQINTAKDALDAWTDYANGVKEAIDQVNETADKIRETFQQRVEEIREWMSNKVEEATYKMELRISINELDIEYAEHLIDTWGDLGVTTGKSWNWLQQNIASNADSLNGVIADSERMWEILNNIDPSKTDPTWFKQKFGEDAWDEYIHNNGALPAEVIEQMQSDASDMISYIDSMYDDAEEMLSMYIDMLDMYMDKFDQAADTLSRQNDRLDMLTDLLEFSGQKYTKEGREAIKEIADTRVDNAQAEVERAAAQLDVAKKAAEDTQQQLNDFYDEYGKDPSQYTESEAFIYNKLKEAADAAEETLNDAESTMTSSIQDLADAAATSIEEMAWVIKQEVIDNLGGDFTDFGDMTTMYDQQYDLDHFFLEDYDKNYQLDKLLGQIDDQMESITDPARMEEYKKLIDEINAANQEGVDITQTDVDLLNAKFELQKAQDAYEEAQNAKNTMRLARDASGNWNYVYSTDESQTEDAAQALADAQYNYDKLLHEARDESSQLWMQAQQEFFEFQETIDRARYESDEKYRAQIDQQMAYYQEKTRLYSEQVIKYNGMLGDDFKDTTLGIITNYGSMEEAQEAYTNQHENYNNQLNENNQHYQEEVDKTCQNVGFDYENLAQTVKDETKSMRDNNDLLRQNIDTLRSEAIQDLDQLNNKIGPWRATFVQNMNMATAAVNELITALQNLQKQQLHESQYTGFNAETDYTAKIQNYVGSQLQNGVTAEELAQDEELFRLVTELKNKLTSEELKDAGHTTVNENWNQQGPDFVQNYITDIINSVVNALEDGTYKIFDEIDEWVVNNKDKIEGTTASGGLIKTPQIRSLAEEEPELVLNGTDTKNILEAVKYMRETVKMKIQSANFEIDRQTKTVKDPTVTNDIQQVDQQVHIDATFPNVSVAAEIEEAFSNLVNQAVQYASSKNRKS